MEVIIGNKQISANGLKNEVINLKTCDEISLRQAKTKEIAKQVELMIIIGERNSNEASNLYQISIRECNNAMLVEKIEDLYLNYIRRFKKVGVIAETTASNDMVDKIVEILKNTKTEGCID